MARKPRFCPVGVPVHVIQRGNNRQVCFGSEDDIKAYAGWLKKFSKKFNVHVHAWVFMTNHVHLLCTPYTENGISMMMQSLGRLYVRYFNFTYRRSGTLWEGRYKSCLVDEEEYLFHLYRYIELNPVRAGMVEDPAEYVWSSYQCNALGRRGELCTPHEKYLQLGTEHIERLTLYRSLFVGHLDKKVIEDIQLATHKGLALGNDRFVDQLEALKGSSLREQKRGRPLGWRESAV